MGFTLACKEQEDFKRMAMNARLPRTQDLIQSVQRQVKTLIDQDWNTIRWTRITILSDPAAKLITMTAHVFSDSTLRVGVSNPDL